MQKVVLATGNPGKVRELASLLADFGLDIVAQTELGVDSAEETGLTFIENAILKARHAAQLTGLPAIADDSGLAVDASAARRASTPPVIPVKVRPTSGIWKSCSTRFATCRTISVRRNSTACWSICAMRKIRRRWFATAAGRASSLAKPQAAAALVTIRFSLFRRKVKPQRS